ncbi:MAG TPA: magnesium transporter CorA family protein [Candidatus Binatia bacterium]|nr:magnesium transporter CorA family protein [Candidatus Binatia bacterium]
MEILHVIAGQPPKRVASLGPLPEKGFYWVDFVRDQATEWAVTMEPVLGCEINPEHVQDSLNPTHGSFFDGMQGYDMLIFEGLGPRDEPLPVETRTAAFFLFDRALVTVRAADNVSILRVKQRLQDSRRTPGSPRTLALLILDTMLDRFLKVREPFSRTLTKMQEDLLDPTNPMDDWVVLMQARREARRLESLAEDQQEALHAWHRGSRLPWRDTELVRLRDSIQHAERLQNSASDQERDLEAAVQLHFASMSHRTNEIVRTLTVFSAIFLPLTFISGVFGMNFEYFPELHARFGYPVVMGAMALLAGGLLWVFRRRGYF